MKKIILLFVSVVLLSSCDNASKEQKADKQTTDSTTVSTTTADVANKSFDELFKAIDAKDINQNIFKLLGKNYSVITAGTDSIYNSMTASWGG